MNDNRAQPRPSPRRPTMAPGVHPDDKVPGRPNISMCNLTLRAQHKVLAMQRRALAMARSKASPGHRAPGK